MARPLPQIASFLLALIAAHAGLAVAGPSAQPAHTLFEALQAPAVRTAVDQELVSLDVALRPDSEVAFLPPMSGG